MFSIILKNPWIFTMILTSFMALVFKMMKKNTSGDVKKQGAYGKVPTHKHSIVKQLCKPSEIVAAITLKLGKGSVLSGKNRSLADGFANLDNESVNVKIYEDAVYCDQMLHRVSRSFADVIAQLPNTKTCPLRTAVGIFYLVLRALDTVEDDMDLQKFEPFVISKDHKGNGSDSRLNAKVRLLCEFYKRFSDDDDDSEIAQQDLSTSQIGEGDEAHLLKNLHRLQYVYRDLPSKAKVVIMNITQEMGEGMSQFIGRDLREGTRDEKDFDHYCHIVAGTVGDGLTRLWAAFDIEDASLISRKDLWDGMGLFLQRTNIIRDVYEDFVDGRAFWPASVWKLYAPSETSGSNIQPNTLKALLTEAPLQSKLDCLNHMIADALELVPKSLEYLNQLKDPAVIRFCAVPQVMAIATLATCYNNPLVFTGVVKIRKGLAAKMLLDCCKDTDDVEELQLAYKRWFSLMSSQILTQIPRNRLSKNSHAVDDSDISYFRVQEACMKINQVTVRGENSERTASEKISNIFNLLNWCAGIAFFGASMYFMNRTTDQNVTNGTIGNLVPRMGDNRSATFEIILVSIGFASLAILLAFAGLPFSMGTSRDSSIQSENNSKKN